MCVQYRLLDDHHTTLPEVDVYALYSLSLSLSLSPDTSTLVSSPVGILNRVLQVSPNVGQFSAVLELLMEWWVFVPLPTRDRSLALRAP